MAQAKKERKERKETRGAEEIKLQEQIDSLSKLEKRTEAQSKQLKELRAKVAPMRFVRLAEQRVPRVLAGIVSIGKLTGAGYTFDKEQGEEIVQALKDAVESVADKFSGTKAAATGFKLSKKEAK